MINDSFSHEKFYEIIIFLYAIKERVGFEKDFDESVNGKRFLRQGNLSNVATVGSERQKFVFYVKKTIQMS